VVVVAVVKAGVVVGIVVVVVVVAVAFARFDPVSIRGSHVFFLKGSSPGFDSHFISEVKIWREPPPPSLGISGCRFFRTAVAILPDNKVLD